MTAVFLLWLITFIYTILYTKRIYYDFKDILKYQTTEIKMRGMIKVGKKEKQWEEC